MSFVSSSAGKHRVTVVTVQGTTKTLECDDPWLDDGNIILAVQENCFRVHRTVLGMHSEVFRDMFAIPRPSDDVGEDIIDGLGCPVIYLQDNVLDVRTMLRALYDRSFVFFYNVPIPVFVLEAFLRMGKKYVIKQLFEEAKQRLMHSSTPLALASELTGTKEEGANLFPRISENDPHNFAIMNVANEAGLLPTLTMTTFYCCLSCPISYICDGYEFEGKMYTLSASNKRYILIAQRYLANVERQMTLSLSQLPLTCSLATTKRQGSYYFPQCTCDSRILSILRSFQQLRCPFSAWVPVWDDGICDSCKVELRSKYEKERIKWWKNLPITLGFGSWEDMENNSEISDDT